MPTVEDIRQDHLNAFLGRSDGGTVPWTDGECDQVIEQALTETWPDLGAFVSGTVATDQSSPIYSLPNNIELVSRIMLEHTSGGSSAVISSVPNWRMHSDSQVVIEPIIRTDATLALRFYGYKPFATDGSDLPDRLASLVAMLAASLAYGIAQGKLGNYENQMALENGRMLTLGDAVGLSAYWQQRYESRLRREPSRVSYAPRAAGRT